MARVMRPLTLTLVLVCTAGTPGQAAETPGDQGSTPGTGPAEARQAAALADDPEPGAGPKRSGSRKAAREHRVGDRREDRAREASGGDSDNGGADTTGTEHGARILGRHRLGQTAPWGPGGPRQFLDRHDDGMGGLPRVADPAGLGTNPRFDYFIDEDGDGIGDGRRLGPRVRSSVLEGRRTRASPRGEPRVPPGRPLIHGRERRR